jgi:hypothetical protein
LSGASAERAIPRRKLFGITTEIVQRAGDAPRRCDRTRIDKLRLTCVIQRVVKAAEHAFQRRQTHEQIGVARIALESFQVLGARPRVVQRHMLQIRPHCQRTVGAVAGECQCSLGGDLRSLD